MLAVYRNFDLKLELTEDAGKKEIRITHGSQSEVISYPGPNAFIPPDDRDLAEALIETGQQVANLLLPPCQIRKAFREHWRESREKGERIRLRLFYPAGAPGDVDALMRIPWEYVYLHIDSDDAPADSAYLLALREDVSIVHCLLKPQVGEVKPTCIDALKVKMAYLSWIDPNDESEETIEDNRQAFQDFADETGKLVRIITTNVQGDHPSPIRRRDEIPEELRAEPGDVVNALQTNHLVHIVSHGETSAIWLKDDDYFTKEEILNAFKFMESPAQVRAVILIACESGVESESIAAAFHEAHVPVVVGIVGSTDITVARHFVDGLYEAIGDWPYDSLERAVTRGRSRLFQQERSGRWHATFSLPRLYLCSEDSVLIPPALLYPAQEIVDCFIDYRNNILDEAGASAEDENWVDTIMRWVDSDQGTWYYVNGPSGSGKSTQIARLTKKLEQDNKHKHLYHFCSEECPDSGDRLGFVRSLIAQLMRQFGSERYCRWCYPDEALSRRVDRPAPHITFPLLVNNADDALQDFVIEPLRKVLIEERRCAHESGEHPPPLPVIVIDGLEHVPNVDTSIVGLLRQNRDVLSKVARFIITANEDTDADRFIRDEIIQRDEPHLRIKPPGDSATPLPMYTYFSDRLSPEILMPLGLENVDQSWPGKALNTLYQRFLDHIWETSGEQQATETYKLLRTLALAREPLSPGLAAYIIKLSSEYTISDLVHQIRPFLKGPARLGIHRKYEHLQTAQYELPSPQPAFEAIETNLDLGLVPALTLDHISIKHFLADTLLGEDTKRADTHALFVEACRQGSREWHEISDWSDLLPIRPESVHNELPAQPGEFPAEGMPLETLSRSAEQERSKEMTQYAWHHLADHAYECYRATGIGTGKRGERAIDFLNLVCNPGFRTVRLASVGMQAALEDIRRGLYIILAEYVLSLQNLTTLRDSLESLETVPALEPILDTLEYLLSSPGLESALINLEASLDHALLASEHMLKLLVDDNNPAIIALERKLRRENGGILALLTFFNLPPDLLGEFVSA